MSYTHALSGLAKRKAILLGHIRELEKDIKSLQSELRKSKLDVDVLDQAMIVMDPDFDPTEIKAKSTYFRQFKRGELSRLCLEALKNAEFSLSHQEIAESVVRDSVNPAVPEAIIGKVRIALYGLKRKGLIIADKKNKNHVRWRIRQHDQLVHVKARQDIIQGAKQLRLVREKGR